MARRSGRRAFTLMELMVVVILIGILTVLAIPTMAEARYNARTMDDASKIAELFREGRTRAIGRGAAMLLMGSTSSASLPGVAGGPDLGTFTLYEGQILGGGAASTLFPLPGGSPVGTCGPPIANYWSTVIAAASANPSTLIDQVNLNNTGDQQAQIWTTIADSDGANPLGNARLLIALCFTPLGKTYYEYANPNPVFTPGVTQSPSLGTVFHGGLQVAVQRSGVSAGTPTGITRTVIIPDSGSTRIVSR